MAKNKDTPPLRFWRRRLGRRASFALEFAMVGPLVFILLFVVFEVSYDQFMQEVLNNAIQFTAREVQTGATQSTPASTFVSTYFCPNTTGGLLNCNNLYVRLEAVAFTSASCTNVTAPAIGDYYDATTGVAPVSNGVLQLGDYYNGLGVAGTGNALGLTPCATIGEDTAANPTPGFCNPGPGQMVLLSAVYVAPSFLNGLILNHITYLGKYVRAQYATAAFVTEPFPNSFTPMSTLKAC